MHAEQAKQDITRVPLLLYGGLLGIELDITHSNLAESLHKFIGDDISTEKDISNVQSPHSSRMQ